MASATDLQVIAFYLPQFHPIPENDEWWGKGFTEWTNVTRAKPLYHGHYQPHLPADLGFYDLRLPEVRHHQVSLAKQYGVHGFCFHYYWFAGRRVLERPVNDYVADKSIDFPFCICWANESWSRRWDGMEKEVLLKQEHTPENDARFIQDVIPILKDPRYIRIKNRPLLVVYRVGMMPDPQLTAGIWREAAAKAGLPGIHLCAAETFGFTEPRASGFDSAVEFPPHGISMTSIANQLNWNQEFHGNAYDYRELVQFSLNRAAPSYRLFRTASPGWDNTARRGANSQFFANANPGEFETWLTGLAEFTKMSNPPGERLLFVNAWNEWAEGAHLEPDQKYGHQYLEAVQNVVAGKQNWKHIVDVLGTNIDMTPKQRQRLLGELSRELEHQQRTIQYYHQLPNYQSIAHKPIAKFTTDSEYATRTGLLIPGANIWFDCINQFNQTCSRIEISTREYILVRGWATAPGIAFTHQTPVVIILTHMNSGETYYAELTKRHTRQDVQQNGFTGGEVGFEGILSVENVPDGRYKLGVIQPDDELECGYFAYTPGVVAILTESSSMPVGTTNGEATPLRVSSNRAA